MNDLTIKSTELHDTFLAVEFELNGCNCKTGISVASVIRFAIMTNEKKFESYKMHELRSACIEDMDLLKEYINHLRKGKSFRFMFQYEWDAMIQDIDIALTLSLINQRTNN